MYEDPRMSGGKRISQGSYISFPKGIETHETTQMKDN
jgi:hypothetical protein